MFLCVKLKNWRKGLSFAPRKSITNLGMNSPHRMEQSYLIELIRTLSPEEKPQAREFAALSFVNEGKMHAWVVPLLDVCFEFVIRENAGDLDKKKVYACLFPDQEFIEGKLDKIMVEAHKVVRSFLLTKTYLREENEFRQVLDFSEIARYRGLIDRHRYALTRLQKIQETSKWKNNTYHYQQFLLEDAIHDLESLHNQMKGDLNVPKVLYSLELNYQLQKVVRLNTFLLQQKATNLDIPEIIEVILNEISIPQRYLEESPSLKINWEICVLLRKTHPAPLDVRALFDLLLIHEHVLDPTALRAFYTYLRSLCAWVANLFSDNEEIRLTLFELYKDNLARGFLHYEGRLHPSTYGAVSLIAVRVKQFDWLLDFIENHKHEIIGENETQDYYRFNKALYLFGIGKFSECLDFIPATTPTVGYLLHGKRLELKALYELRSDMLSYRLDAFKMFLSRTSQKLLSDNERKIHIEFANLLTQLTSSAPGDTKRAERLIHRIQEKKQTADWRWLLDKAEELCSH